MSIEATRAPTPDEIEEIHAERESYFPSVDCLFSFNHYSEMNHWNEIVKEFQQGDYDIDAAIEMRFDLLSFVLAEAGEL